MNISKLQTISITVLLTLIFSYFFIAIYVKISEKYNNKTTIEISQKELLQFEEAKITLHAFRELLLDVPDDVFNNVIVESYYWEQIEQYYEKYGDEYEL